VLLTLSDDATKRDFSHSIFQQFELSPKNYFFSSAIFSVMHFFTHSEKLQDTKNLSQGQSFSFLFISSFLWCNIKIFYYLPLLRYVLLANIIFFYYFSKFLQLLLIFITYAISLYLGKNIFSIITLLDVQFSAHVSQLHRRDFLSRKNTGE
jgi:hypothetical protein